MWFITCDVVYITRRRFGAMTSGAAASIVFGGACGAIGRRISEAAAAADGRLTARPRSNATTSATGTRPLGLERDRDAVLQMPSKPVAGTLPLFVALHGAGGSGQGFLRRIGAAADELGIAVMAPDSRGDTWDAIRGGFGSDVEFLDRALRRVFDMVSADASRVAVGGFSDGATYALSLGLLNGDLFRRVVAFSPGFIVDGPAEGTPSIFLSHGTADRILPIDRCSRVIVPQLRRRGYEVTFREFDGGHEVPPPIAAEAMRWVAGA